MKLLLVFIPLIGGAVCWLTASLLIRFLFRPVNPITLPVIKIRLQGFLPSKREELTAGLGEIFQTQIQSAVTGDSCFAFEIREKLTAAVVRATRARLDERIPFIVPGKIRRKIMDIAEESIRRETLIFIESMAGDLRGGKGPGADFSRLIEEKIRTWDPAALELKVNAAREIIWVKAAAFAIGFFSGLLQLLVVWLASA